MKTFITIIVSIFLGCMIGAIICHDFMDSPKPTTVSPDITLKIKSYIYGINTDGTTDNFIDVQVEGDILIPFEYKDMVKFENAVVLSNGQFSINDTTKWLSTRISIDGITYDIKDYHILGKNGFFGDKKADSIFYYKGGVLDWAGPIVQQ